MKQRPSFLSLIRTLLFFFLWWSFTFVWFFVCLVTLILPGRPLLKVCAVWCRVTLWLLKVVCGVSWEITGTENLPDYPVILLSKHQSAWETFFLFSAMPKNVSFLLKKELLTIPFFGWILAKMGMIAIDRSKGVNAFRSLVRAGNEKLAQGGWIAVFPEGTRMRPGQTGIYHNGGTMLAVKTNTPVLPVALNTGECWPKHTFIKSPGHITVSFGQPMPPDGKTAGALMDDVKTWIEGEMRVISPHVYDRKDRAD